MGMKSEVESKTEVLFRTAFLERSAFNSSLLNEKDKRYLRNLTIPLDYTTPLRYSYHTVTMEAAVIGTNVGIGKFYSMCSGYLMGKLVRQGVQYGGTRYRSILNCLPTIDEKYFSMGYNYYNGMLYPVNEFKIRLLEGIGGNSVMVQIDNLGVRELSVDSNFDIFEWSFDYEKYVKPIRVDSVERLKDTSHSSYCEVLNKYLVNSVEKLIKCTVPTDRVMAALSAIEEGLKLGSSISEPEIEPTTGLMWV